MTKWEELSEKFTVEGEVNIGIQIQINKKQMKTQKDEKRQHYKLQQ
jgi:hypothetical protein